ncbi:hypothetical protein TNCV_182001 [Trichonephila clavipes]|nr:hypothetical protein TNCV_182001 [Trichonephila clavipes]
MHVRKRRFIPSGMNSQIFTGSVTNLGEDMLSSLIFLEGLHRTERCLPSTSQICSIGFKVDERSGYSFRSSIPCTAQQRDLYVLSSINHTLFRNNGHQGSWLGDMDERMGREFCRDKLLL